MDDITVTVKLFAQYRKERFKIEQREYPKGTSVHDVIIETDINVADFPIGVMIVNGRHVEEDHLLKDGDTLALFPKVGGG
jgi:molybdopterin converting factor small subunit